MKEADRMMKEAPVYIVAGDEMLKLMNRQFPEYQAIPFRDDLSKGSCPGYALDAGFITERASFWGVSEADYAEKMFKRAKKYKRWKRKYLKVYGGCLQCRYDSFDYENICKYCSQNYANRFEKRG